MFGQGSAKSSDGKSDVKIADELPVATFAGTEITDMSEADGGAGPMDAAVLPDSGVSL